MNNLFGGIAMQVAVLAVADATLRKRALSSTAREPVILLQGVLLIFVLVIAIGRMVVGEPAGWPIGPWSAAVLCAALISFYLMRRYEGHAAWRPVTEEGRLEELEGDGGGGAGDPEEDSREPSADRRDLRRSLGTLIGFAALAALAILVSGVLLARIGEVIVARTGLDSSFVGAALLAASTSLCGAWRTWEPTRSRSSRSISWGCTPCTG